ncbi:MAG: hypothetical protein GY754_20675 [bacterium]|nr:hypothetical protein [bacterium]
MKLKIVFILFISLILLILAATLSGEDYQYQYFSKEKDKYVPFSDYIPRYRRHMQTVPHFLEDYYELYGMKQHYNENSLRANIARMKTALSRKFRHPSMALVRVDSDKEYLKYRNLMFMHINLLIMRNYLKIGSRYDMKRLHFYSRNYAEDISKSLVIAEKHYKEAMPYWKKAKRYAQKASRIKITTDMGYIESERFSIINKDLNYENIIKNHIRKVGRKKQKLSRYLNEK